MYYCSRTDVVDIGQVDQRSNFNYLGVFVERMYPRLLLLCMMDCRRQVCLASSDSLRQIQLSNPDSEFS